MTAKVTLVVLIISSYFVMVMEHPVVQFIKLIWKYFRLVGFSEILIFNSQRVHTAPNFREFFKIWGKCLHLNSTQAELLWITSQP